MSACIRLGSWRCPSGNGVDVFFRRTAAGRARLEMEWDAPPPLAQADAAHYAEVILPAVVRRLREFTETVGLTAIVSAGA